MAMIATNSTPLAFANGLFARIGDAFFKMTTRNYEASAGYRAARYAAALNELSDEELKARGLSRQRIVPHAFSGT
ncbi:MAG: hypothetical protein ACPGFA_12390, partial [Pikeienuella sp.]